MSNPTFNIDVHYLTRVEGHGNIKVDVKNGEVKECVWEIPEAPRFFEAMVRGRSWNEVATNLANLRYLFHSPYFCILESH